MGTISTGNFGLIIAFVIPGFLCLWGLSLSSDELRRWLWSPTYGVDGQLRIAARHVFLDQTVIQSRNLSNFF